MDTPFKIGTTVELIYDDVILVEKGGLGFTCLPKGTRGTVHHDIGAYRLVVKIDKTAYIVWREYIKEIDEH